MPEGLPKRDDLIEEAPHETEAIIDDGIEGAKRRLGSTTLEAYARLEKVPLHAAIIDETEDVARKARFYGEQKMQAEINNARGIKGFLNRIWKGSIARNYYRQKYINESRQQILENGSLLLETEGLTGEGERLRYNADMCEMFAEQSEDVINEERGDYRKSLAEDYPEIHAKIKELISKYAHGEIGQEQAKQELNAEIQQLRNKISDGSAMTIDNVIDIANEAKRRFEDEITVVESVGSMINHDEAMARVMEGFDVYYGKRSIDKIDPHHNAVDRIAERIQNSKVGSIVSAESIALATGAAACVAEFFGKRLTSTAMVAVPGASASLFGALKAGTTFEHERAQATVDMRYSREVNNSQERRRKIMETVVQTLPTEIITADLDAKMQAIRDLENKNQDPSSKINVLLETVAKYQARINMDGLQGRSLLSFSSELNAPSEQLELFRSMGEAKTFLSNHGIDAKRELAKDSQRIIEATEGLNSDIEQKDKLARKRKIGRIASRAGIALISGAAIGMAMQELHALADPDIKGILEADDPNATRLTAGRKLLDFFKPPKTTEENFIGNFDITTREALEQGQDFDFQRIGDGSYNLVKDGKVLARGIDWNNQTGKLTPESIQKLREQGISLARTNGISQSIEYTTTAQETVEKDLSEYCETVNPKINREFWYDNDTLTPDQNELNAHLYFDGASHGFVTSMTTGGSMHNGQTVDFKALAEAGKLKLLISPTDGTQSNPIEVAGRVLRNGQVAFLPERGSVAEQFFDNDGKFLGRFAEIAEIRETAADGTMSVAPLASYVGNNYTGGTVKVIEEVQKTISKTIEVPQYSFTIPSETSENLPMSLPMLFPFTLDGAMNESRRNSNDGPKPDVWNESGYGTTNQHPGHRAEGMTGENGGLTHEQRIRKILSESSPHMQAGKELHLGDEVSWYRDQLKALRSDEYIQKVDSAVKQSEELQMMDNRLKTIVAIPVYGPQEYENIYKTLSLYAQQQDVEPGSMMVVLNINYRPADAEKRKDDIEKTKAAIERARRDFPNLQIATFEDGDNQKSVYSACNYMYDVILSAVDEAIRDGAISPEQDIAILRNDADAHHMDSHYVQSMQQAMDENPKTPLFTGTSWIGVEEQQDIPGFGSLVTVDRMANVLQALDGAIHTEGRSECFRIKHFAAVRGFGTDEFPWPIPIKDGSVAATDDLYIGWRIEDAMRGYISNVQYYKGRSPYSIIDENTRLLRRVPRAVIDSDHERLLEPYYRSLKPVKEGDNALVVEDAYRSFGDRPSGTDLEAFKSRLDNRQDFNGMVWQFNKNVNYFMGFFRNNRQIYENVVNTFLGKSDQPLWEYDEQGRFKLTREGEQRYHDVMLLRISDQGSNPMREAIDSGRWVTPIVDPGV